MTKLERLREILYSGGGVWRALQIEDKVWCAGCVASGPSSEGGYTVLEHKDDCAWLRIDAILAEPDHDAPLTGNQHRRVYRANSVGRLHDAAFPIDCSVCRTEIRED